MFFIIVLFAVALMGDHPLVAPMANILIPNIHHVFRLIEVYDLPLLNPSLPWVNTTPVTAQWGHQSTRLDHLAFLDESRMVSAPSTCLHTISPAQLDSPLGPQSRWLDVFGALDQSTTPPTTTASLPDTSLLLRFTWPNYFTLFDIRNIGSSLVVPIQFNSIPLVRALSSAVVILPALLGLHDLNTRLRVHTNHWLARLATLMYYVIMAFDVPEQVVALAAGFAFPFACSAALWLFRMALLIPIEELPQKYNALERSHQELTAENDAAQENVRTLSNEKKLLAAAVQYLDGHVITLAQELDSTSRRITKVEEALTAANQVEEDQVARLVITLAQELDTTSRRVTKVQGELAAASQLSEDQAAGLASNSATVACLTEEAEYADLKHETLVMLQTDAMNQNTALQDYLNEALQEKERADAEHAQEVEGLSEKVEKVTDSLEVARQANLVMSKSGWLKRSREERFRSSFLALRHSHLFE